MGCCEWHWRGTSFQSHLRCTYRSVKSTFQSECSPSSSRNRRNSELLEFEPHWWIAGQGSQSRFHLMPRRKRGPSWWSAVHWMWACSNPSDQKPDRSHRPSRSKPFAPCTFSKCRCTAEETIRTCLDFLPEVALAIRLAFVSPVELFEIVGLPGSDSIMTDGSITVGADRGPLEEQPNTLHVAAAGTIESLKWRQLSY